MEHAKKSIWDCSITVHAAIKEETNAVLLSIMKEHGGMKKSKIIQSMLETHPDYIKRLKEMKDDGFFV